jgi:hypothetical protein
MDTDEHRFSKPTQAGLELSASIRGQVVKTHINKGFLEAMDGHCQQDDGLKHYPARAPLKLAHNTLTCRDGSGA